MLRTAPVIASTRVLTSRSRSRWPRTPRGLLDGRDALAGALGAAGDRVDQTAGLGLDLADEGRDLARCGLRFLRELAYLLGDDREPAALLAGAGGLDRGVQREQVRLPRDARDRVHDAANLVRALRQRADRGADLCEASASAAMASVAVPAARTPSSARSRAFWAASAVTALAALSVAIRDASLTAARVDSTIRT